MTRSHAALVALVRHAGADAPGLAELVETLGAERALRQLIDGAGAPGDRAPTLFDAPGPETPPGPDATAAPDPAARLAAATADLARWAAAGVSVLGAADRGYPDNLRAVHDRPAALWIAGALRPSDERSLAIVGTRRPSGAGLARAAAFARACARANMTVVSGLADGIDTAAHRAALDAGGRTVAVIGTGHERAYPPANAELQRQLAAEHAVISPFEPATPPAADTFRRRNAVMSGLARGTVIVEASARSGTRVQARRALAHGRPVFLAAPLLAQEWATELATRPGVHVVDDPAQVLALVARLDATTPPER